jgi:ferritin
MKISTKMQDALNKQINKELYSAYTYLSMAGYFEDRSLTGFAAWMKKQAQEEVTHAMKIWEFILARDGMPTLEKIEKPKAEWKSVADIAETTLKHEQSVTKSIHEIVDLSLEEKDQASNEFLRWFVNEQVEEEDQSSELLDRVKLAGDDGAALLILDSELGKRE